MGALYASCPFDKWGIDIVGPFPKVARGKKFLIVAIDYFSKWVEAKALGRITETVVMSFVWKNICCRFGVPRILISDNGSQFNGRKMVAWCKEMKIIQRFTAVNHPQTNGQVEVTNRTLVNGIKARLEDCIGNWADELDSVLWSYRTGVRSATREPHCNLVYGAMHVAPVEIGANSYRVMAYKEEENEGLRRDELDLVEEVRAVAKMKSDAYKEQINAGYNKRVEIRRFGVGDLVLRRADALKPNRKLELEWEGPFKVVKVLKGGAYELQDKRGKLLPRPWNVNNLKKYYV